MAAAANGTTSKVVRPYLLAGPGDTMMAMERCARPALWCSKGSRTSSRDAAFDRYVVPEIPGLRRRAIGLTRSVHDADDLVQETIVRAYKAIERFDGRYARAWLRTILRHAWINENRKRKPIPVQDSELVPVGQPLADTWGVPEDVLAYQLMDPDLEVALDHLPRRYRTVVEAVTMRGLSCREVARDLAIPLGTVLSRLHRARAALRDDLTTSPVAPLSRARAAPRPPRKPAVGRHAA